MGYSRAGFDVVGVDIKPQPHYPFAFVLGDAMDYLDAYGEDFDAIHASPPCETWSQLTPKAFRYRHRALIAPTRSLLVSLGRPYVIENVPSAKRQLIEPFMLCGSMFGLGIQRHRFFEVNWRLSALVQSCDHLKAPVLISGTHRRTWEPRYEYSADACRQASGIDWMTRVELDKAIPPAYTEYIGRQLLQALGEPRAAGAVAGDVA